jgi:hypothetical protein
MELNIAKPRRDQKRNDGAGTRLKTPQSVGLQRIRTLWSRTDDGRKLRTPRRSELSYYSNTVTFTVMLRLEQLEGRIRDQRILDHKRDLIGQILNIQRECELLSEISSFLLRKEAK